MFILDMCKAQQFDLKVNKITPFFLLRGLT